MSCTAPIVYRNSHARLIVLARMGCSLPLISVVNFLIYHHFSSRMGCSLPANLSYELSNSSSFELTNFSLIPCIFSALTSASAGSGLA